MHVLSPHPDAQVPETERRVTTGETTKLGRAIVITSGKGGVGKTTTTANLGTALAQRGARVALIDADIGLRNLDIVLGLENRVQFHLLDVLEETVTLDDALVADKHSDGLFLLAAAQSREKEEVDTEKMRALVTQLRERFDYVIIDSPAGIETGFKNAVAGAQEAIVVCTPEVSAVRDVDRVVGLLGNRFRPQLVINRVRPQLVKKGTMLSVEDVDAFLRLPLLGVIADEPQIIVTTNRGEPLALQREGQTANAYRAIAARIAGEDVPAPRVELPKPTLFERLFRGGRA
jgi:septum site-determining protein MinD